ncbi:hypothetical protein AGLY_012752 [Aphis glycines]|uniref:Uncharacterized protein n=1 Tax=Aphis glycines TaxID=307491 RepID=A0A6G0TA70_APHGL|nr:hypothetical protein AGLY_012752 [Aphis glycines]
MRREDHEWSLESRLLAQTMCSSLLSFHDEYNNKEMKEPALIVQCCQSIIFVFEIYKIKKNIEKLKRSCLEELFKFILVKKMMFLRLKTVKRVKINGKYEKMFLRLKFKFLRPMYVKIVKMYKPKNSTLSFQPEKCYECLNFKFLRNRVSITIYPQTIFNTCYYSKSISRKYLKISPVNSTFFFLLAFEVQILIKIRQNHEYLQFIFKL